MGIRGTARADHFGSAKYGGGIVLHGTGGTHGTSVDIIRLFTAREYKSTAHYGTVLVI